MGLLDFLRRKDESAMPDPESAEFQAAVAGSALPGSEGATATPGDWRSVGDAASAEELGKRAAAQLGMDPASVEVDQAATEQTIDLRGTGAREEVLEVLRRHGIDPDRKGQQIDAGKVPGLQEAVFKVLRAAGVQVPGMADGPGTTIAAGPGGMRISSSVDPLAQVEHLAKKRDAGEITEAEFEAQKKQLLGG
jgi:hypothetical protein